MSALFTFTLLAKVTLLLLGALGLDHVLRHKSALACAAMWNAALLALAAIPLLCLTMPSVTIPVAFEVGIEQPSPQLQQAGKGDTTFPAANLPLLSDITEESGIVPRGPVISEPPRTSFTIPSIWQLLGCIYLAGVGVFTLRLLFSLLAVRRLKQQATDIQDVAWQRTLQDCLSQIGSRAKIRLKQSSEITVPIACGWLVPTIVIPADLVAALSASARKGVLIHELAHLLRRDYPWQLLLRCLQVVLWFHPLLWLAERRIHFVRERVCDEFSIFILGDSERYCDTLIDIAARCQSRLSLSLGLAIVRKGRLAQRLSAMEQSEGSREYELAGKPRLALGTASLLLTLLVSCFSLQPLAEAKEPAENPVEEKSKEAGKNDEPKRNAKSQIITLKGTAEDEKGNPVVGATVFVFLDDGDQQKRSVNLTSCRQIAKTETNENGIYEFRDLAVPILPAPESERRPDGSTLEILAVAKDHKFAWRGPLLVWANGEIQFKGRPEILTKEQLTAINFHFRPTKPISGRVLDEEGKPIAGATVRLTDCRQQWLEPRVYNDSLNLSLGGKQKQPAPDSVAVRTSNTDGVFEFATIPFEMRCGFMVDHSNHATVLVWVTNGVRDLVGGPEPIKVQKGDVRIKMRRAFAVPVEVKFAGTDKPVAGAMVRALESVTDEAQDPVFAFESTNEQGRAVLKLPSGNFSLAAVFAGSKPGPPVEIKVDKTPREKPIEIRVQSVSAEKSPPGAKPNEEPAKEGLKQEKKGGDTKQPAKPAATAKETIAGRKVENGRSEPKTATDYYNRGMARKLPQEYDEALADFTKAIELDFGFADAYFSRSSLYTDHPDFAKRDYAKGVADLSKMLELEPKRFSARFNRALAYESLREYDKAIADYSRVFDEDTDFSRAGGRSDEYLAMTYHYRGRAYQWYKHDDAKALADFTEALRLDPKIEMVHYRRGNAYHGLKEYAKAAEDYAVALQGKPDYPNLLVSIAWQLATCPEAKFRDGKKAIELATKANESFKWKLPEHVDALAAAYAENGQFAEAIKWEEKAIELLEKGQVDSRKKMQNRLELYQASRPFREGE